MKKALLFLLVGTFALLGTAAAQTIVNNPSNTGSTSAGHNAVVTIPDIVAIRLVGAGTGQVTFGVTQTEIIDAATTPTELAPTTSDLDRVEVFTNNATGARLTVGVTYDDGVTGLAVADLLIDSKAANGQSVNFASKTTGGYATAYDFAGGSNAWGLEIDGDEEQGTGTYTITYTVNANP